MYSNTQLNGLTCCRRLLLHRILLSEPILKYPSTTCKVPTCYSEWSRSYGIWMQVLSLRCPLSSPSLSELQSRGHHLYCLLCQYFLFKPFVHKRFNNISIYFITRRETEYSYDFKSGSGLNKINTRINTCFVFSFIGPVLCSSGVGVLLIGLKKHALLNFDRGLYNWKA